MPTASQPPRIAELKRAMRMRGLQREARYAAQAAKSDEPLPDKRKRIDFEAMPKRDVIQRARHLARMDRRRHYTEPQPNLGKPGQRD